jgi:endonuclease/exonuclease/phosphatase family metal-dependent hydrolase
MRSGTRVRCLAGGAYAATVDAMSERDQRRPSRRIRVMSGVAVVALVSLSAVAVHQLPNDPITTVRGAGADDPGAVTSFAVGAKVVAEGVRGGVATSTPVDGERAGSGATGAAPSNSTVIPGGDDAAPSAPPASPPPAGTAANVDQPSGAVFAEAASGDAAAADVAERNDESGAGSNTGRDGNDQSNGSNADQATDAGDGAHGGSGDREHTENAARRDERLVVLQWNIAGGAMHHGRTDTGMTAAVVRLVKQSGAQYISLNEVCYPQYLDIVSRLIDDGYLPKRRGHATFAPSRNTTCVSDGVTPYGNALLSIRRFDQVDTVQLERLPGGVESQNRGGAEWRTVVCVHDAVSTLAVCGTHITTHADLRLRQVAQVGRLSRRLIAAGETPVVAGDFNVERDQTSVLETTMVSTADPAVGATGSATAVPEQPGKVIDYVFASAKHLVETRSPSLVAIPERCWVPKWTQDTARMLPCSDHRPFIAEFTVRVRSGPGVR